jgi:hypothetical protein
LTKLTRKPEPGSIINPTLTPAQMITGVTHPPSEFIENFMDVKVVRSKYPSLQERNILYAHLEPDLTNQVVEVLDKLGWNSTDFTRLVLKQNFYENRSGLYALFTTINERRLLESDDIDDLKFIRDNLKNVIPGFIRLTAETVATFKRQNNNNNNNKP